MSSACISQYCSEGCCNYFGYCPTISGSSLSTECYYWYYWDYWWIYYVVGSIAFVLLVSSFIGCCVYRRRRRRQLNQDTIIINEGPNPSYGNQYPTNPNYQNQHPNQYPNNNYNNYNNNYNNQDGNNAAYQLGQVTTQNTQNQPYMGEPVYLADQPGNKY